MSQVKRQTTIAVHAGLAADPGDDTAYVDGLMADLVLDVRVLTGTSVQAEAREVIDIGWSLPYDGGTADFTVGAWVTGYAFDGGPNARGQVIAETGTTAVGTLELTNVSGKFVDNMVIVDDGGTPGKAIVNSATGGSRATALGDVWATVLVSGVARGSAPFENPDVAAGDGDQRHVTPREFAIQYTFNTVTTTDYAVDIMQLF